VTRYRDGGGCERAQAQVTGHKTESIYRRYAIVAEADLKEAGAKLSASMAEVEKAQRGPGPS